MTSLDLTYFAKTLSEGLKNFLKSENIEVINSDFDNLVDKLINEFKLPYPKQAQTPTQLLNNYAKTIYNFEKIITPQNLGTEAHEQIMLWGVLKAQDHND